MFRIKYIVNIIIITLLLAAVAISRDGRISGHSVEEIVHPVENQDEEAVVSHLSDGVVSLNSAPVAKDIAGYGGRTPVVVYVKDGRIESVETEAYSETVSFFDEVVRSGLLERWQGMTLSEAAVAPIDAVSGATFTSVSIIKNVQRVAQYGSEVEVSAESSFISLLKGLDLRSIIALLVVASGVVMTFLHTKNRILEIVQLVLNVAVLGFWCGSFLSLSQLVSWLSNGVNLSMSVVAVALLVVAVFMPLLGQNGSYCRMHCPMGSAQELLGKLPVQRLKLSPMANKWLNRLRYYILLALLFMMWLGVGFDIMNYEIFSAFILSSASGVVLFMSGVFLLLSIFVHRPYCRFVCPTGALITMSQMK